MMIFNLTLTERYAEMPRSGDPITDLRRMLVGDGRRAASHPRPHPVGGPPAGRHRRHADARDRQRAGSGADPRRAGGGGPGRRPAPRRPRTVGLRVLPHPGAAHRERTTGPGRSVRRRPRRARAQRCRCAPARRGTSRRPDARETSGRRRSSVRWSWWWAPWSSSSAPVVVVVGAVVVVVGAVVEVDVLERGGRRRARRRGRHRGVRRRGVVVAAQRQPDEHARGDHDRRHERDEPGGGPSRPAGLTRGRPDPVRADRAAGRTRTTRSRVDDRHGPRRLADRTVDGRDRDGGLLAGSTHGHGAVGIGRVDGLGRGWSLRLVTHPGDATSRPPRVQGRARTTPSCPAGPPRPPTRRPARPRCAGPAPTAPAGGGCRHEGGRGCGRTPPPGGCGRPT